MSRPPACAGRECNCSSSIGKSRSCLRRRKAVRPAAPSSCACPPRGTASADKTAAFLRRQLEVAVDVEDDVGGIGDEDADRAIVPAGTMAALALMRPSGEFMVETSGWASPVGQMVR